MLEILRSIHLAHFPLAFPQQKYYFGSTLNQKADFIAPAPSARVCYIRFQNIEILRMFESYAVQESPYSARDGTAAFWAGVLLYGVFLYPKPKKVYHVHLPASRVWRISQRRP